MSKFVLYECGICSGYHPWKWNGDCREDAHRFGDPEEYAKQLGISNNTVEVRPWKDRMAADKEEE